MRRRARRAIREPWSGELLVRGPNVVSGYWNKPEATAEAFTDGWLHTGDLARIDDEGLVYLVDRMKDMINRGGENVYCVEVENALAGAPGVYEAAVLGVPDEMMGEKVGAVVVPLAGRRPRRGRRARLLGAHIADFKVPQYVAVREDPLPRNPGGKLLKRSCATTRAGAVTALRQPISGRSPMFEPILFRNRPRPLQVLLAGVVPGRGRCDRRGVDRSLQRCLLGVRHSRRDRRYRRRLRAPKRWGGAGRGFVAGLTYGIALLLAHAIAGTDPKVSLGNPPASLALVTAIAGAPLSALGGRIARRQRERKIAPG